MCKEHRFKPDSRRARVQYPHSLERNAPPKLLSETDPTTEVLLRSTAVSLNPYNVHLVQSNRFSLAVGRETRRACRIVFSNIKTPVVGFCKLQRSETCVISRPDPTF